MLAMLASAECGAFHCDFPALSPVACGSLSWAKLLSGGQFGHAHADREQSCHSNCGPQDVQSVPAPVVAGRVNPARKTGFAAQIVLRPDLFSSGMSLRA